MVDKRKRRVGEQKGKEVVDEVVVSEEEVVMRREADEEWEKLGETIEMSGNKQAKEAYLAVEEISKTIRAKEKKRAEVLKEIEYSSKEAEKDISRVKESGAIGEELEKQIGNLTTVNNHNYVKKVLVRVDKKIKDLRLSRVKQRMEVHRLMGE